MFVLKIGQLEDENKMLRDRLKELEGTALTAINEKKTLSNELIKVRKSHEQFFLPSITKEKQTEKIALSKLGQPRSKQRFKGTLHITLNRT
jgi:hypothetical protein